MIEKRRCTITIDFSLVSFSALKLLLRKKKKKKRTYPRLQCAKGKKTPRDTGRDGLYVIAPFCLHVSMLCSRYRPKILWFP